jgi:hypothetical protein
VTKLQKNSKMKFYIFVVAFVSCMQDHSTIKIKGSVDTEVNLAILQACRGFSHSTMCFVSISDSGSGLGIATLNGTAVCQFFKY